MSEEPNKSQDRSVLEKHVQTAIQVLLVGLCVWMANTVQSTALEVATLTERVSALQVQVAKFETSAQGAYPAALAARDKAETDAKLREISDRIRELEQRR